MSVLCRVGKRGGVEVVHLMGVLKWCRFEAVLQALDIRMSRDEAPLNPLNAAGVCCSVCCSACCGVWRYSLESS